MFNRDVLAQETWKGYTITAYWHEPMTSGFPREIVYSVTHKGKHCRNCKYPKHVGDIGMRMVNKLENALKVAGQATQLGLPQIAEVTQ